MKTPRKNKKGLVYLVGAGPGDAGLFTMRGAQVLHEADVVIYDWLVNPTLLEWCRKAEKIYAGKNPHQAAENGRKRRCRDQSKINRMIAKFASQGKTVVRLKGGDPFIFGRGGEEASYLQEKGISYEVIPGVSAGYAVPAYAGIPVTDRRFASSVTFVTAHGDPNKKESHVDWKALAKIQGTLVFFMGVKNLPQVVQSLMEGGLPKETKVSVIEWGSLPWQRVVEGNLTDIVKKVAKQKVQSPAITVIGEVNKLRKDLAWFEKKPLFEKTVLLTRARSQVSRLKKVLEHQGARVLEYPAIRILPPQDWKPLDLALNSMNSFDWVLFTSTNG